MRAEIWGCCKCEAIPTFMWFYNGDGYCAACVKKYFPDAKIRPTQRNTAINLSDIISQAKENSRCRAQTALVWFDAERFIEESMKIAWHARDKEMEGIELRLADLAAGHQAAVAEVVKLQHEVKTLIDKEYHFLGETMACIGFVSDGLRMNPASKVTEEISISKLNDVCTSMRYRKIALKSIREKK